MHAKLRRIARWARTEAPTAAVPFRLLGQSLRGPADRGRAERAAAADGGEWASRLEGVDVVSLDVFDTLVQRRLLVPDDAHEVVLERAREALSQDERLDGLPWRAMRVRAEAVARAHSKTPDVTLDDIYAQLEALVDAELLQALKQAELRTEVELARPTVRGRKLWRAAQNAGAGILVTTDIYLPKETIEEILQRCDYSGWHGIIASGEDRLAKFDGSSFRRITADHPGRRVLHAGDNPLSDVRAARAGGVEAEHLSRPLDSLAAARSGLSSVADPRGRHGRDSMSRRTALGVSANAALIERWLDSTAGADERTDAIDRIGYGVLGPALVGFSQYLARQAARHGTERFLFLAREGAILQRAYAAYAAADTAAAVPNDYFVISTRMLGLAELVQPTSEQSLHFLTKTSAPLTPVDYLARVLPDAPAEAVQAACRRAGVRPGARLTRKEALRRLGPVFAEFEGELAALGEASRPVLLDYLASWGTARPGTAIVDVGWAGSIQSALNRLTGETHTGFYLALSDCAVTRATPRLHGWIDERRGERGGASFRRLYARVPALEVLLANVEAGSGAAVRRAAAAEAADVDGFELDYLPNEFEGEDARTIERLQGRAIEFVRDYAENAAALPQSLRELSFEAAFGPVYELLTKPSIAQLRALSGIRFDGSYGVRPAKLGQWWLPTSLRRR